jgi:DNA repair protein RadC
MIKPSTMTRNAAVHEDGSSGARERSAWSVACRSRRVCDLPPEERPRERMAGRGPCMLSNRELVALLLGTGAVGVSALDLADEVLARGLRDLAGRSLHELEGMRGLGRAKAARLLAALELGSRAASEGPSDRPLCRTPEEAARYLLPRYSLRPVETFGVLALDVRQRLKREAIVSIGSVSGSVVHPREVFGEAIAARASSVLVFHNHPSGDPEPSSEDVALTRRLASAGGLIGIDLSDHLILGAGCFVSLRGRGVL